jgi:hypothetical protein
MILLEGFEACIRLLSELNDEAKEALKVFKKRRRNK